MTSKDVVLEALSKVNDPELHRSITELGMVEDVTIDGSALKLKILLTISGCPMRDRLTKDISAAALTVSGITSVVLNLA